MLVSSKVSFWYLIHAAHILSILKAACVHLCNTKVYIVISWIKVMYQSPHKMTVSFGHFIN